ncbi:hypothetical protein F5884DRAFT_781568 [Xylogone sp. PMI_703]|nr:hypothetical protein F5884DRAFT_781568 [Xylogone sp. PMI_703]
MTSTQKHACSQCRASKIRCLLDTLAEHGKCRRCNDTGADCVFGSIAPRQRRKRTDTRVAALEKQIAALTAAIETRAGRSSPLGGGELGNVDSGLAESHDRECSVGGPPATSHPEAGEQTVREDEPCFLDETIPGLVGSDLLPLDIAVNLFTEFVTNVVPEYPIFALADGESFDSLRTSQPTLLLAIITAGSRGTNPVLFRKLHSRLLERLADQILVHGHRSLQLAKAIMLMEVWYDPPDNMEQLNFYMWIQITWIMVQQLGLWPWSDTSSSMTEDKDIGCKLDGWRTAFASYVSMSTVAISLRRRLTLTWTRGMLENLETFDQSSVSNNDKRLVAWVRLQMIAEEVESLRIRLLRSPESVGQNTVVPGNQSLVHTLERKLDQWRYTSQSMLNDSLRVHYFYCRSKLYELAAKICHAQFPAFPDQDSTELTSSSKGRDMNYVRILMSLIQSSHSILDIVLYLDIPKYLKCPTVTTVRALYAIQEIYTLQKQTHISNLIGEEAFALKFYAKQTRQFFEQALGQGGFQVPRMALDMLAKVTNCILVTDLERPDQPQPLHIPIDTGSAKEYHSRTSNDLEAILIMDVTHSEPNTDSSLAVERPTIPRPARAIVNEASTQSPFLDNYNPGGIGDTSMISEFEIMVMPDVLVEPSWLFTECDLGSTGGR